MASWHSWQLVQATATEFVNFFSERQKSAVKKFISWSLIWHYTVGIDKALIGPTPYTKKSGAMTDDKRFDRPSLLGLSYQSNPITHG